jgi:NAD(P)-dependent dehydrogenase (short-subunit alcohol dehydrogenase family)
MANELGPSVRVWAVHPGRLRTALAPADADVEPADAARRLVALVGEDTKTPLSYLSLDEGPLPW